VIEDYDQLEWVWIVFDHVPDDELLPGSATPAGVLYSEQLCLFL